MKRKTQKANGSHNGKAQPRDIFERISARFTADIDWLRALLDLAEQYTFIGEAYPLSREEVIDDIRGVIATVINERNVTDGARIRDNQILRIKEKLS